MKKPTFFMKAFALGLVGTVVTITICSALIAEIRAKI